MSKICCFTGHRKITALSQKEMLSRIEKKLIELIEDKDFTDFRAGGARGFDSLAALTVLNLKQKYPHIKLHLFLPCKGQERQYSPIEKHIYYYTIAHADSVKYIQENYSEGVMFARNRALVDGADLCIAYLEKLKGGTYQTVNYAQKNKVKAINLLKT